MAQEAILFTRRGVMNKPSIFLERILSKPPKEVEQEHQKHHPTSKSE